MPLSKYFGGSGEKVMSNMTKGYGEKKGKQVFYATANKKSSMPKADKPKGGRKPPRKAPGKAGLKKY